MTSPISSTTPNLTTTLADLSKSEQRPNVGNGPTGLLQDSGEKPSYQDFLTTGAPTGFATLSDVFDSMTQTVGLLKKGIEGLTKMSGLAGDARGALLEAQSSEDLSLRGDALGQFGQLPAEISTIALSAEYEGRSLLAEVTRTETVEATSVSVTLVYSNYTDLQDAFALEAEDPADQIDEALEFLDAFLETLREHKGELTKGFEAIRGGDGVPALLSEIFPNIDVDLTQDDLEEEAIQVLALQTRQELAGSTQSLTPESQLNALRFFS